jgi:hypothetical protein
MFSVCTNPECQASFKYQEGQLFRFHKEHASVERPPNTHSVQRFWYCGNCCHSYLRDYWDGCAVMIEHRHEATDNSDMLRFIAAA